MPAWCGGAMILLLVLETSPDFAYLPNVSYCLMVACQSSKPEQLAAAASLFKTSLAGYPVCFIEHADMSR